MHDIYPAKVSEWLKYHTNEQERRPMPSEPYSFGTRRWRPDVGQWEVNGILQGTPQWGPGAMAKPGVSPTGTAQPQGIQSTGSSAVGNPYAAIEPAACRAEQKPDRSSSDIMNEKGREPAGIPFGLGTHQV
jgi:hypothetical protein